jgi:uncharacterized membrane protein YGL010W
MAAHAQLLTSAPWLVHALLIPMAVLLCLLVLARSVLTASAPSLQVLAMLRMAAQSTLLCDVLMVNARSTLPCASLSSPVQVTWRPSVMMALVSQTLVSVHLGLLVVVLHQSSAAI